jgi:flavin-dependent dehydrogenase
VHQIVVESRQTVVYSDRGTFHAKIVIGADGAHSIVAKHAGPKKSEKNHTSAGLRVYYEGVTALHHHQFIELHFCKEILPGYLWLFPLPDGKANVGLGMLSGEISRKRINLRETLHHLLTHHDPFKERFKNARPLETVKGFSLPLGSRKRKISGERYLLAGDAASLIDPFTGEGIGNALRSGRVAAHHVQKCFASGDFSASFNKGYDSEIYNLMWGEFRISRGLQRLSRYPWLFNLVVRKANEHPHILGVLTDALAQADKKQLLLHPRFYYRLLFS